MSDSESILYLVLFNLMVTGACVFWHCVRRGRIEFNHITLFSIGFSLYWILPIAVGALGTFRDHPGAVSWYKIYDEVPDTTIILYLSICLIAYLAFVAGSSLAGKLVDKPIQKKRLLAFDTKLTDLYLVFALLAAAAFTFLVRDQLFQGYQASIYGDSGWRGSFTAASLPLLSLAFIYTAKLEERADAAPAFVKLTMTRFFLFYFIVAILALSMGGRLYFLSGILMLLVYRTVFFRRIHVAVALIFFVVLAAMAGIAGVFRTGSAMGLGRLTINVFMEFMFTGFSLVHFLRYDTLELLNVPVFLISDFINLVPTFMFPGKAAALLHPEAYGHVVFSPGGALSSFFSFMINFGVVGTWFALFVFGYFLNYLCKKSHLLLPRVMYVMVSGWLAFSFFRDPFSVSIVKCMFEFSILIPTLVVASMHILTLSMNAYAIHAKCE